MSTKKSVKIRIKGKFVGTSCAEHVCMVLKERPANLNIQNYATNSLEMGKKMEDVKRKTVPFIIRNCAKIYFVNGNVGIKTVDFST